MERTHLLYLIRERNLRELSFAEKEELATYIREMDKNTFQQDMVAILDELAPDRVYDAERYDVLYTEICKVDKVNSKKIISIQYKKWLVAAVFILLSTTIFWLTKNIISPKNPPAGVSENVVVMPGGQKAQLILQNGKVIDLDSVPAGIIAQEGNVMVEKTKDGQIIYKSIDAAAEKVFWHTMATPLGGEYKLVLPDGTQVWLNAGSSISYPAVFTGTERMVKVKGEVFFDVRKEKDKPFSVWVDDKMYVDVLGTQFNVCAYDGVVKTTLLEGKVTAGMLVEQQKKGGAVVLKPGQQAKQTQPGGEIEITDNVNTAQEIAWKNGLFDFNDLPLAVVMKQLERWYDIKVEYASAIPVVKIKGKMYRDIALKDVLDILEKMEIKYKMEGRILKILP